MDFLGRPLFSSAARIGVMYVLLLVLGAVTTVAGLALVTSVATGAFDAETITPGMIAAVGGLLLIGLGLTVRTLQRIEDALTARPMPRPLRPGETAAALSAAERADMPTPIPFPARPNADSASPAAAHTAKATAKTAEDVVLERLREKFPTLVRLDQTPAMEDANVSLLPPALPGAEENGGEMVNGASVARTNGSPAAKLPPRRVSSARAAGSPAGPKGSVFDAFWPKGPRTREDAEEAAVPPAAEPAPADEVTAPESQAAIEEPAALEPAPASVLKSGVVEGMAYTLYSDGSIEAQLPQGLVRFGSITELRNHIESGS
jgi:hypothetical protein